MDSKGQYSVDFLFAVFIFAITFSYAFYYLVSAFAPHVSTFDIEASAYRVAMILTEDSGLNVTLGKNGTNYTVELRNDWEVNGTINNTISDWYDIPKALGRLNTTIARVGLADYSRIFEFKSSYEKATPCLLNETKVERFFNVSWWADPCRFNFNPNDPSQLRSFYVNLSYLIGLGGSKLYHFNISIRDLNGDVVKVGGVECEIGYPVPESGKVAKFERLVVIDKDVIGCLDGGRGDCINAGSVKRLVVYVW